MSDEDAEDVSGIEGVFQIMHGIINDFVWEEDALQRAQQAFVQTHEQVLSPSSRHASDAHVWLRVRASPPSTPAIET